MTNKIEKSGLSLFIITPAMLEGVETLAKQFKVQGDKHTSDFLMEVKTGLSKTVAIIDLMSSIAEQLRNNVKTADLIDQIFVQLKGSDKTLQVNVKSETLV
jgi:hypothetical protein